MGRAAHVLGWWPAWRLVQHCLGRGVWPKGGMEHRAATVCLLPRSMHCCPHCPADEVVCAHQWSDVGQEKPQRPLRL